MVEGCSRARKAVVAAGEGKGVQDYFRDAWVEVIRARGRDWRVCQIMACKIGNFW